MQQNKTARLAGFFYLLLVITGILNLQYFPSLWYKPGNPNETLQHLQTSTSVLRWEIATGILSYLVFLALVLALYHLLNNVQKGLAQVMVLLVAISLPLSFTNLLHKFSILSLLDHASLSGNALENQVAMQMHMYQNGIFLTQIFWGLWLFPLGILIYKSGFIPRILGLFLMLGCVGYLTAFFGDLLYPHFENTLMASIADYPQQVAEIGTCLWLLIMGTYRTKKTKIRSMF